MKYCHPRTYAWLPGLVAAVVLLCHGQRAGAQELEPRRWSHLPANANFAAAAYAYTKADIYLDPVLDLKDVELDLNTYAAKYIRTFGVFDRSARVDLLVPYQSARWEGELSGEPAATERNGFDDPNVRVSMNFLGSPSLQGAEFAKYRAAHPVETLAGAAVSAQLPMGEYYEERLLNLGENRFIVRPELGVIHNHRKWSFEVTGQVAFYTDNEEFFNGNTREQDPYSFVHGHVVHTFRPGLWAAASTGYGYGGQSAINGVEKDDTKSDFAWALSLGYPINKSVGVKVGYLSARTQESTGADSDTITAVTSVLW